MIYDAIAHTIARAIALVAPGYASGYLKSHNLVRAYAAARVDGPNKNYRPKRSSGAQEITSSWQAVTNKARALQRDNSSVAGMGRRFVSGLVGEGSWPRPKVLKPSAENLFDFDTALNTELLRRWEVFATEGGANGDSIYQLQRLAAGHFFYDGGLLLVKRIINRQLRIEAVELDQLDVMKDVDNGTTRIVGGKEIDQYNKPVAYWLKPRFPTEKMTDSAKILAANVIDLYDRERASAVGGISRLAASVNNFYNIGEYRSDTMKLARTALGYGLFVTKNNPDDMWRNDGNDDAEGVEYECITPAGVHYLNAGEAITAVKPENPGTQYEPFLRSELRAASVGAGMSYESVSNDGSQTNFSGTRQMLLFERAMIRYTFAIFEEKFYSRLYRWFVDHEVGFNKLMIPGYFANPARFLRASWSRPKTEWVDPLKDAKAAKEEILMGGNTVTEFCESAGRDFEEVAATQAYEEKVRKAAGLPSIFSPEELNSVDTLPEITEQNAEAALEEVNKWLT